MRLQAKILALLVPFVALPLLVLGWMGYADARNSAAEERLGRAAILLDELTRRFDQEVSTTRANARVISGMQLLHRYVLIESELDRYRLAQPTLLRQLAEYQTAYPGYQEIQLLLPDGYEDTRSTLTLLPNATEDEAESEFFRLIEAADEHLIDRVVRSPNTGQWVLMVSSRIRSIDPGRDRATAELKTRGYLVITSTLSSLQEFARRSTERGGEQLMLLDETGRALDSPDSPDSPDSDPQSGSSEPLFGSELLARLKSGDPGNRSAVAQIEGQPHRVLGRKLTEGLYAVAALPERLLLGEAKRIGAVVAATTTISILLASGLLYFALRRLLLLPITRLRDSARELGRGNFDAAPQIMRNDELGELAQSFQEMGRNLRRSRDQIQHIAYHDGLTGLPNRAMMTKLLERAIGHARGVQGSVAMLFLDIDDFKRVNDSLGHEAGDQLLQQVSERLAAALRTSDWIGRMSEDAPPETIARIGGDEFIIVLPSLKSEDGACTVAGRILSKIAAPFQLAGHEFHVTSSIGIALYPRDAATADDLVRRADQAMYHAKDHGKNAYEVYSDEMNSLAVERLAIENALHKALDNDEFCLHYQPLIDLQTGALVGAEALLRWQSPELGQVSPDTFIPVAEESGLIVPIGEWVLREACRQNARWQNEGLSGLSISVNISPRQFSRPNFEATVTASLDDSGLDGKLLCIELTETCIMASDDRGLRTLDAIKDLGVQISMDDFGTGYSSLAALRRLPIDELKIDQSFISEITNDPDDIAIVSTIIAMGHSLNLRVIAEGVEDQHQLELLRDRGCHLMQGYLVSRPLTAADFASFAAQHGASALERYSSTT